ncbi:hypothetical protein C8Q76DRAFT_768744 [Earliella scabrosa]|nr:hypothetical protein C8Q76DRAFT_768744 [Earliella scabrosa]
MPAISVSDMWTRLSQLKHLVIFGASYCDVGYISSKSPHPTAEEPLGVPFPGYTWCEPGKPNWVGHFVQKVRAQLDMRLLVYNYARGGDTAEGVGRQVHDQFLPDLAPKPDWAPWSSDDTLFLTFVGINDCGRNSRSLDLIGATQESVKELFGLQEELYQSGARHFCFIDVPPTNRFPDGARYKKAELTVLAWNEKLEEAARSFSATHPDATVLIWSSWHLFTQMFNDPSSFGFTAEDLMDGGAVFVDGLHPTSAVHEIIAAQLLDFLLNISPPAKPTEDGL